MCPSSPALLYISDMLGTDASKRCGQHGGWDAAASGKEAKEIGVRLFQEGLGDSPVPKPVRNFRALKRALIDARERAITILVERWPAAHPSFTQKVLPDGAVPQQAAHYGCGGLWMAIVDLWAGMSRPMERMSCSCMESEVCSIGIM